REVLLRRRLGREEEGRHALPGRAGRHALARRGLLRHDERAGRAGARRHEDRPEGQPLRLGAGRGVGHLAGGETSRHHQCAGAPRQLRLGRRGRQDALHDRAHGAVPHPPQDPGHSPVKEERVMAVGVIRTQSNAIQATATLEAVGQAIVRYGLVLVVGWIGAMKFTAYEAAGIQPLVANSPLMSWMYGFLSVRAFSNLLGAVEVAVAVMIALRPVSSRIAAVGSGMAVMMFLTTLSFLFSTPGWEPSLGGFPALSVVPGQFLLKDVVLLGAAVWSLGEALSAARTGCPPRTPTALSSSTSRSGRVCPASSCTTGGVDHTQFRDGFDPLGDALRLVCYDHRCNGRSGRPPIETLTLEQLADDADALRSHLGYKARRQGARVSPSALPAPSRWPPPLRPFGVRPPRKPAARNAFIARDRSPACTRRSTSFVKRS